MFPNLLEKIKANDSDLINYNIDEMTSNNANNKNFMYIEIGKDRNPYWIFYDIAYNYVFSCYFY